LSLTLTIAGGGTGGHVFPGIALAEAFLDLVPGGAVSFVGTEGGLEARTVPGRGFEIDFVPSGQVLGKGAGGLLGVAMMVKGISSAFSVLGRRRPDLVFGVGGYASVPVAVAALMAGVPLFLQEQNAVPGRANRMLGRMARRVYVGFEGAVPYFPVGKVEVTGNPVRREIAAARQQGTPLEEGDSFVVFALGGSQGARAISRLVVDMARRVKREGYAMKFVLQTGPGEFESVSATVREEQLPIEPFSFTERIGEVFAGCHAVVMRAGALSIAEAALFGKPCILIPYPHAADRHQERNAEEFCATGAGVWMAQDKATEEKVLEALMKWFSNPRRRAAAGEAAMGFSRPDAAAQIVLSAIRRVGKAEARRV
jgi:UDP-N-acetylglucosamine--N-acetylmuramyl-(pentapeptide) pyrophosphoryl-undecaprenol N-acetylglucosamine transferase